MVCPLRAPLDLAGVTGRHARHVARNRCARGTGRHSRSHACHAPSEQSFRRGWAWPISRRAHFRGEARRAPRRGLSVPHGRDRADARGDRGVPHRRPSPTRIRPRPRHRPVHRHRHLHRTLGAGRGPEVEGPPRPARHTHPSRTGAAPWTAREEHRRRHPGDLRRPGPRHPVRPSHRHQCEVAGHRGPRRTPYRGGRTPGRGRDGHGGEHCRPRDGRRRSRRGGRVVHRQGPRGRLRPALRGSWHTRPPRRARGVASLRRGGLTLMFELGQFVTECRMAASRQGPASVLEIMRQVVADPEAIKSAVSALSPSGSIADAILHRAEDVLVLNATLSPFMISPPHDHTMWAVIGIYEGQEDNVFFERREGTLREKNRRSLRAGETIVLGPEVIHAVSNPLSTPTLGLHVYGGDLVAAPRTMWHPDTLEELPYDIPQFFTWVAEMTKARRPRRDPS